MNVPGGCCCEFPQTCGGLGALLCLGCGGDICVCECGGETECDGCGECNDDFGDYPDED